MADNNRFTRSNSDSFGWRRLPPYREQTAAESDGSDSEPPANAEDALLPPPSPFTRPNIFQTPASPPQPSMGSQSSRPLLAPFVREQSAAPSATNMATPTDSPTRGRRGRRSLFYRNRRRGGRDASITSPSRGNTRRRRVSIGNGIGSIPEDASLQYERDLAMALEHDILSDDTYQSHDEDDLPRPDFFPEEWDGSAGDAEGQLARLRSRLGGSQLAFDDTALDPTSVRAFQRFTRSTKRARNGYEAADNSSVQRTLSNRGAVAVMLYRSALPNPEANDIWPEYRSAAKLPIRYYLLDKDSEKDIRGPPDYQSKRRPQKNVKRITEKRKGSDKSSEDLLDAPIGRPKWDLPVELVELIASYLNRDDIKSLRMVSQELNFFVSQVIFKTVVVPFNTEIYGMLAQGQKPDLKGKKRAKLEQPGYSWKNANGDEVYNGHGLDVFKGFGGHITRYGMSFEVNEDSLSQPPAKSLTQKKTSFWGAYEWPFEEYRRFDAVAGLETAADETPRMKIAFSELTRIKELALSVDSGLGWLNGPDRSIRARILQRPPAVFGTLKDVPDRRVQAQQELWSHMERRHQEAGQDIKLATLYRLDGSRPLSELEEASMIAEEQPEVPYLDPHVIHEATPHDTSEVPLPTSFDDPEVLDRFVLTPSLSGTGILFSSTMPPSDAGQIMSPIIPANLTKAQKEWLLETEWAQRAFMSSYMLSIIDNPLTFTPVHTLNISRLSDRYLPMLNRPDFWNALPNLRNLALLVIPGWRTVHKDEAGFVHTPRINPATGLDAFCELLTNQVANRPKIQNLTVGWIGGGEHAEGLHSRNKLLMPAPLMRPGIPRPPEGTAALNLDMMTELDPNTLRAALLHFPHVERLTLKNCWITPSALLQFVKIHDAKNLQSLVLDSVSLTAVLRPNANGHQAAAPPAPPLAGLLGANALLNAFNNIGGQHAPGLVVHQVHPQALPNNNQLIQWLAQSVQAQLQNLQGNAGGAQQQNPMVALQTQLQQQVQLLQAQNQQQGQPIVQIPLGQPGLFAHAPVPPNAINQLAVNALATQMNAVHHPVGLPVQQTLQPPANPQSLLLSQPREGSWMSIIDQISPGTNLKDFDSDHSKADPDRQTSLRSIEFISCGYVKLPHTSFDQAAIEHGHGLAAALRNPSFSKRHHALGPAMLSAKWAHLGEIVQEVDPTELGALDAGWNLKTGWTDAEEARAVEFDGAMPGGTGRFTGILRASDRVRDADENGAGSAS